MRVLICGGGVIGASIAYFSSQKGVEVVVVERTGVACAASGKSGGFLALDWCDGSPLGSLARRSFELHAELAAGFEGRWGYRRLDTLAVAASARRKLGAGQGSGLPEWITRDALLHQRLGTPATTAQVDPAAFTTAMMDAAIEQGARLQIGCVTDLVRDEDRVTGVVVDGETIEGDAVVIAMGPWSVLAAQWLPLPAVYGLKGNSVIFRSRDPVPPHALFVEYESDDGAVDTPEVYPRADGTTYVCGLSSEAPLPADPAEVGPDPGAPERLRAMTGHLAPVLGEAEILAAQACYRPVTRDGLPLIGRVPGVEGAYVATGHSVWGMLNAPATGEAMAELIADGRTSAVDLSPFDPARLPMLRPEDIRAVHNDNTGRRRMGRSIEGTAADGHTLGIYRADPDGKPRGAVVIVQEIFGVNGHIRSVCDDFANEGYVAVAPALFDRVERGVELGYGDDGMKRGRAIREQVSLDDALADVEAAAKEVAAVGRIGIVGYCWGGTVAWVGATRCDTFSAAVGYYGGGVPDLAAEQPNCPVQLHFGEHDHAIPLDGVRKVQATHPELPVYIYPAGHGFNCDQRASYHAESARLARERTLAFLREHVG